MSPSQTLRASARSSSQKKKLDVVVRLWRWRRGGGRNLLPRNGSGLGKKVRPMGRSSSSADEKDRKRKKRREPSASPRRRTEEKEAKKRKSRVERDRGAYGVGKAMDFQKEHSDDWCQARQMRVFAGGSGQEEPSAQLGLVEYFQRRPGRLTSRLLTKMQTLLSRDAGPPFNAASSRDLTPATAASYLLTVMVPTYREKLGIRFLRELRTVSAALDHIASGHGEVAGDIPSQRMKALELQPNDGGWQRAQFLELMAPEGAGLAEQEEQWMAAREQALEQKIFQQVSRGRPGSQKKEIQPRRARERKETEEASGQPPRARLRTRKIPQAASIIEKVLGEGQ